MYSFKSNHVTLCWSGSDNNTSMHLHRRYFVWHTNFDLSFTHDNAFHLLKIKSMKHALKHTGVYLLDFFCSGFQFYQSPLVLTELFQHNLINVSYLTACFLYQVMMTLHFLNDVADDAESTQTSEITS